MEVMEQEESKKSSNKQNLPKILRNKTQNKFSILAQKTTASSNFCNKKYRHHMLSDKNNEPNKQNNTFKSYILPEIKYFMVFGIVSKTNIVSKKLMLDAQRKMKNLTVQIPDIDLDSIYYLLEVIEQKVSDSNLLWQKLEQCLKKPYPPSLKTMILYLGIFLCSINSLHSKSDELSQSLFHQISAMKITQYFTVYLLIRARIKSNLREWHQVLKIVSKILAFSWYFKEKDLEIWCYFEFSKIYFQMDEPETAEYFKKKSEGGLLEPQSSAFRLIQERNLSFQLEEIKSKGKDFNLSEIIYQNRLKQVPKQTITMKEMVSDQRKLQSSIKKINKDCGVKYVDNMLNRLSLCNFYSYSKNLGQNLKLKYGDHTIRTHQSHIKNMSMFFRIKRQVECPKTNPFYTIQNSSKNWIVLKEMLKVIISQGMFLKNQQEFQNQ